MSRKSEVTNVVDLVSVRVAPSMAMIVIWVALLSLKEGPNTEIDRVTNSTLKFTAA